MVNRSDNTARHRRTTRPAPAATATRHRSGVLPAAHSNEPRPGEPRAGGQNIDGQFADVERLAHQLAGVAKALADELTRLHRSIDERREHDRAALTMTRDITEQARAVAAIEIEQRCRRMREDHARQLRELARGYREVLRQVREAGVQASPAD